MSEAARVGDAAHGPTPEEVDADGGLLLPATGGSPDVFINGLGVVRVDDGGVGWQVSAGSSGVFVNGKPAARAGDATDHAGASGVLTAGSPDVSLGDARPGTPKDRPHNRSVQLAFTDALGRAVDDLIVEVFCPHQPLSRLEVSGDATIGGLCSSATVTVHKSLQQGEWDDAASQGASPHVILSAHVPAPTPTPPGDPLTGGAVAPPDTTIHAPGPAGTAPSQGSVHLPSPGGTTAVKYTTVHNWMELVYRAFGHHLPTEHHHLALLGVREASLHGAGKAGPNHVDHLEREAAAGDTAHLSFTREKSSHTYNDLIFAGYADKHVKSKQVVDVYECTIDASPRHHGKLDLPYITEGHLMHATPGSFKDYPGKHVALHLFKGAHEAHHAVKGGVKDLLDLAHKELGHTEHPPFSNRQKYGAWYGMDGAFWCAMFVSWVFDHIGMTHVHYAECNDGANHFRSGAWGTWHPGSGPTAHPGDIVFYQFMGAGNFDHTGIVVRDNGSTITTIEGNTSPQSSGSQDNGGGVYLKTRSKNSLVGGFGRPHFHAENPSLPVIRWGGDGKTVHRRSEQDSTLLHHKYFHEKHGKQHVDPHQKRYAHFVHTFNEAKNKSRIPYLVVSSRYVKTYAEWVKWVEQNAGKVPDPRSVLRESGLHAPHGVPRHYVPSFVSRAYVEKVMDHAHRMHDRHEAHKLRDEIEGCLMKLAVHV